MEISAVVVSYNSENFLPRNLDSLQCQKLPCKEIVVVDNHSQDGSAAVVDRFPDVLHIRLDRNSGYGAAANLGILRCTSDIIVVANADTFFPPEFNSQVDRFFRQRRDIDIVAPLLLRFDGQTVDSAGQTRSLSLYPREIGFNRKLDIASLHEQSCFSACGAVTVFSRAALERLRMADEFYDEDFFMFWEDFDLGWRASAKGLEIRFTPEIQAFHFRSGTMKKSPLSRFSLALCRSPELKYHLVKNRYLTLIKNFRWRRFGWAIPFIIGKDLVWVGALTLSAPVIIIRLLKSGRIFKRATIKRKALRRHE